MTANLGDRLKTLKTICLIRGDLCKYELTRLVIAAKPKRDRSCEFTAAMVNCFKAF